MALQIITKLSVNNTSMDKKHREKYKNAILYFSKNLNKYQLGSTKLAKLMYYLDFINYRDREVAVTGTTYYKQEYGPLAKDLVEVVGELVEEGRLKVESALFDGGKETHNYEALKKPDMNVFTEEESILLRQLVDKYRAWGRDQIVSKSHLEAPWIKAKEGGEISYKFAFDIDDFDDSAEREYAREDESMKEVIESELKGA